MDGRKAKSYLVVTFGEKKIIVGGSHVSFVTPHVNHKMHISPFFSRLHTKQMRLARGGAPGGAHTRPCQWRFGEEFTPRTPLQVRSSCLSACGRGGGEGSRRQPPMRESQTGGIRRGRRREADHLLGREDTCSKKKTNLRFIKMAGG